MPVERILVIGKTSPEWSEKKRELIICTAGITPNFEWRRLHPMFMEDLNKIHNFSWIDVKVSTEKLPDPRPETRRIARGLADHIKEVEKVKDPSIRKWFVEKCAQPCVETLKDQKKTLGIVKPVIREVEITPIEKPSEKEDQTSLTLWASNPYLAKLVERERWRKDYAKKDFEIRFRFVCGPECQHEHKMRVLDIELFMLYQHLFRKHEDRDLALTEMQQVIQKEHNEKDIYLGLGTHIKYPFVGFMIGSIIRLKKGLTITKPEGVSESI